jgi:hypothetical protein
LNRFLPEKLMNEFGFENELEQAASSYPVNGCLSGFLIPPLAVIAIAIVMIITLSQVEVASTAPMHTSTPKVLAEQNSNISINPKDISIASLFTPEIRSWEAKIETWSKKWNLDPNLVATVMQIESCGDPKALSSAGAMGLFQVMPFHFAEGEDPYLPVTNAQRGLSYLKRSLDSGGSIRLALAGYNAGITGATRPESDWPAETKRYVYWGTGIYKDAKQGKGSSGRLQEWLSHGGSSLCNQASQRLSLSP